MNTQTATATMIGIQECSANQRSKYKKREREREMSFFINLRCIKDSSRETNILMISICEKALVRPIMQHFHTFLCVTLLRRAVWKGLVTIFFLIIYCNLVKEVNQQFSLKIVLLNYYLLLMRQRKTHHKNY